MSNPTHLNCEAVVENPESYQYFQGFQGHDINVYYCHLLSRSQGEQGLPTWGSSLLHWHHVLRVLSITKCFDSWCDSKVEINCKASEIHDLFATCNQFQNSNYFQPRKAKTQLVQNQSQFQDHLVIHFNHFLFLPGQIPPSPKLVKHLLCFRKALRNRMAARIVVTGRTVPARSGERLAPETRET